MFDKTTILQVFGCLMKEPTLLLQEEYGTLSVEDFPEKFHKIVFGAIHNLIKSDVLVLTPMEVDSFLSQYTKNYLIFNDNDGMDYLDTCTTLAKLENFDYNYKRLKKFSLLEELAREGFQTKLLYNGDILDPKEQEEMQQRFDSMDNDEIIDFFDKKIVGVRDKYSTNTGQFGHQAGFGAKDLIQQFKEVPEMGAPLSSKILTTIARGARKKKFYLRSGETGTGKSRLAIGDAVEIGVRYMFDTKSGQWVDTGFCQPTLFITTELEFKETQSLFLACISDINEEKIKDGNYTEEEEIRINRAAEILEESSLWVEYIPSFNLTDIERIMRKYKLNHKVGFVFFDYIFTSAKMLMEIASQTKGMKLREDNILYLFSDRMKFLCNSLDVFIFSATQVNGDAKNVKNADEAVLRGAKAINIMVALYRKIVLKNSVNLQM